MTSLVQNFVSAFCSGNGYAVAAIFVPQAPYHDPDRLVEFFKSSTPATIQRNLRHYLLESAELQFSKAESNTWAEILAAYWKAIAEIFVAHDVEQTTPETNRQWESVYEAWKDVNNSFIRGFNTSMLPPWTLPCLYNSGKYLRKFAIKSDTKTARVKEITGVVDSYEDDAIEEGNNEKLEDCAQQLRRIFSLCIGDRAPVEESRKWGLYYVATLMFKTYFKLDTVTQAKNIIQSIEVSRKDMPPIEAFPKSHRVAYSYYVGRIYFMDEDYIQAEKHLTEAWLLCHREAKKNLELILTYLIPCRLLTSHALPTMMLLSPYPRLQKLFGPLGASIRKGDLAGFDSALAEGESEFIKYYIYLTLERGRNITERNLFRKVFIAGGYEPLKEGQTEADRIRRTRIPLAEFAAALRLSMRLKEEDTLDDEEVECLIANMIYKNLMKGYISSERRMIVLSKGGAAFPGTGV